MSTSSAADAAKSWLYIKNGVDMIMKDNDTAFTAELYMNMYTAIHNYCVTPYIQSASATASTKNVHRTRKSLPGGELYSKLQDYLSEHVQHLADTLPTDNSKDIISVYNKYWKQYIDGAKYLDHIFSYLNRHWVKQERDEGSQRKIVCDIFTLCLYYWQTIMFQQRGSEVVTALLSEINFDRSGGAVDRDALKLSISSIVQIGFDVLLSKRTNLAFYTEKFEGPFLSDTAAFYESEADRVLNSEGVVNYMRKINERLIQEKERVSAYLNPSTENLLMAQCRKVLIEDHIAPLQSEFITLLREDQRNDLHVLYTLLEQVPGGLDPVRLTLLQFVKEKGTEVARGLSEKFATFESSLEKSTEPRIYVSEMLQVCDKYEDLVAKSMGNSETLKSAVKEGCALFINDNAVAKPDPNSDSRTPELLARYSDYLLKKSSRVLDAKSVERGLNSILRLLSFTEEKDVFEKHYTRMLSRRLVQQTTANPDWETLMMTLLGDICDFEYTNKLQRMFQDMQTSAKLRKMFCELYPMSHSTQSFHPLVLAEGFWPLPYRNIQGFELPQPLKFAFDQFNEFYDKIHNGRRLKWLWNFGKADMTLNMPHGKSVNLSVNAYQMAILLAFNDTTELTKAELQHQVPISHELLDSSLGYILRAGILIEKENDIYCFNKDFESKKARINLNLPLKGEPKPENAETASEMDEKRQSFLQSVVIRIMKINHAYPHSKLTEEVMQIALTKFRPSISDVNSAIEALIERGYLKRSEQVMDVFEYVA